MVNTLLANNNQLQAQLQRAIDAVRTLTRSNTDSVGMSSQDIKHGAVELPVNDHDDITEPTSPPRSRGISSRSLSMQRPTPARPSIHRDQISTPLSTIKVPTIPIESFNGKNKDITVIQWLMQFRQIADSCGWDDVTAIRLAGIKLSGAAQDWYARKGKTLTKWSQFHQSLCSRYGVRVHRDLAQRVVERLTQHSNESIENSMIGFSVH